MAVSKEQEQELLEATQSLRTTASLLRSSGVGRIALSTALATVLKEVIKMGPDEEDCRKLGDLMSGYITQK